MVASYTYGAYGELLSGRRDLTRLLYNGRMGVMTEDNGLYYMRQRYYNPQIKRFINQDVLRGSITNSQSLNRYSYVQGNPVSYIDPFGLSPVVHIVKESHTGGAHLVLSLIGFVPGPIGMFADLTDAGIYAFVDHDMGFASLACLSAVSSVAGNAAKAAAAGTRTVTKTGEVVMDLNALGKYARATEIQHTCDVIRNTGILGIFTGRGINDYIALKDMAESDEYVSWGDMLGQTGVIAGDVVMGFLASKGIGRGVRGFNTAAELATDVEALVISRAAEEMTVSYTGERLGEPAYATLMRERGITSSLSEETQNILNDYFWYFQIHYYGIS